MTEYLDSPFVRASAVEIPCADKPGCAPIPPGTKTIVVTNVGPCPAWVSIIGAGQEEKAIAGVGHEILAGARLIYSNVKGATQVAAISPMLKACHTNGRVWVEFGEGDRETRSYRAPQPKQAEPAAVPKTEEAVA